MKNFYILYGVNKGLIKEELDKIIKSINCDDVIYYDLDTFDILDVIDDALEKVNDCLYSYGIEIAVQIALCEVNAKAYDLYYAAYSHPATFDYIKDWAAKKNYHLFKDKLPDWSEEDFRTIENIASGIELAAFTTPCGRYFSLNDKISLFLD